MFQNAVQQKMVFPFCVCVCHNLAVHHNFLWYCVGVFSLPLHFLAGKLATTCTITLTLGFPIRVFFFLRSHTLRRHTGIFTYLAIRPVSISFGQDRQTSKKIKNKYCLTVNNFMQLLSNLGLMHGKLPCKQLLLAGTCVPFL